MRQAARQYRIRSNYRVAAVAQAAATAVASCRGRLKIAKHPSHCRKRFALTASGTVLAEKRKFQLWRGRFARSERTERVRRQVPSRAK